MIRTIPTFAGVVLMVVGLLGCEKLAGNGEAARLTGAVSVPDRHVKTCYEQHRRDDPGLAGKIELALTVKADGVVSGVSVSSNSTGNDDLAGCVSRRIYGWQMEGTGEEREVAHAFTFQ
jgi:hypothetical protein